MFPRLPVLRRYLSVLLITAMVAGALYLIIPDVWRKTVFIYRVAERVLSNEKRDGSAIGELDGIPVVIPKKYSVYRHYDDDPHLMEKGWWFPPKRTFQSKLRSMGFEVRYPDMASEEMKTTEEKLYNPDIHTTMWMRVMVSTSKLGQEYLERLFWSNFDPKRRQHYVYERIAGLTHGLEGYRPLGVDLEARDIKSGKGVDMDDFNVYVFRDENNKITDYIECWNMIHNATRCIHYFNSELYPFSHIEVNYRRDLLCHWENIHESVNKLVSSFAVVSDSRH